MSTPNETLSTFAAELQVLTSLDQVREKRRELQAWVREQFQGLSSLEQEEKRRVGQELNRVKTEMERIVSERLRELEGTADLKPVRVSFAAEIYLPSPALSQTQRSSTPRREAGSFDISILAREDTWATTIQEQIEQVLGQDLVTVRLIDVYEGKQVNGGTRSYTFHVVYHRQRGEPAAVWREVGKAITRLLHVEIPGADR